MRPFLDVPKWRLEAACREQGLTWADDPTNQDTTFLRNHMRALLSQTRGKAQSQHPVSNLLCTSQSQPPMPRAATAPAHPWHTKSSGTLTQPTQHQNNTEMLQDSIAKCQLDVIPKCFSQKGDIMQAILHVQQRCAAAHNSLSDQAKALLTESMKASQHKQDHGTLESGQQVRAEWSLAVGPLAKAPSAVALHALTAILQVCLLITASWFGNQAAVRYCNSCDGFCCHSTTHNLLVCKGFF